MMLRRLHILACAKAGSCALGPFSVGYTMSISGHLRALTEFLRTTPAICERVIGTIRRECLDWLVPLSEAHLRFTLKSWIAHYNGGRPHMALGPGIPDPPGSTL